MIDFNYDLNPRAVAFAHYLSMALGASPGASSAIVLGMGERRWDTLPSLVARGAVSVRTVAQYGMRERGITFVVEAKGKSLVMWWAEHGSSDELVIRTKVADGTAAFLPEMLEFSGEALEMGREKCSYWDNFQNASDHLVSLIGNFLEGQGVEPAENS